MLQSGRCYVACVLFLLSTLTISPMVQAEGYKGFRALKQEECSRLEEKQVTQLPETWHKYGNFIKICELKQRKDQIAKVSIISIWADAYLDAQPANATWEQFPLPLVVDRNFRLIGQLPELYPTHQAHELKIYYGKWQGGLPTEIKLHVYNPAAYGDFDYPPLIWNKTTRLYETNNKEIKDGVGK